MHKFLNPARKKRLYIVLFIIAGVSIALAIMMTALRQHINFFYSPSQVAAGEVSAGQRFRIGGLVVDESVMRVEDSLQVRFALTDGAQEVWVTYAGILPDLFREGQGIVAQGALDEAGVFQADEVLAKHDENYMPPEVAQALAEAGHPTQLSTPDAT